MTVARAVLALSALVASGLLWSIVRDLRSLWSDTQSSCPLCHRWGACRESCPAARCDVLGGGR